MDGFQNSHVQKRYDDVTWNLPEALSTKLVGSNLNPGCFFFAWKVFQGFWRRECRNARIPMWSLSSPHLPRLLELWYIFFGGGWEELLTVTNKIYQKMVGLIYAMKFTTIEFFETSGGLILMPHMLPYVGCMVEWYIYLTWFFRGFLLGSRWVNYTISIHLDPIGF